MNRKKPKRRARVLIVDDHPAVREALATRIGRQPDLEVCGEAADTSEALRLVAQAPDQIVEAVRRVLAGKVWLSEPMAERMLQRAVGTPRPEATRSPVDTLA